MTTLARPEVATPHAAPEVDQPRRTGGLAVDDTMSVLGAMVGALALVWLVYDNLLALSGVVGFVIVWYATFLTLYATVTAIGNPRPVVIDRLVGAVVAGGAAIVGGALLSTIYFILDNAEPALVHLNFYTHDMSGVRPTADLSHGGVLHAMVGSGEQILIAVIISMPLGIGTAIYMTEVGGRAATWVRTVVEAMTALPDILAGLFVYTLLIIGLHWSRTGFAAALALSVTMVPIIARSADVVLRLVPHGLREASFALGASRWQTVRRVVLPTARAGLATSLILGVARIAGETAPLLIVSGASTFLNDDPLRNPMNSLPLFIFASVRSGEPTSIARGYGAAALLLFLVSTLFFTARFLARDKAPRR